MEIHKPSLDLLENVKNHQHIPYFLKQQKVLVTHDHP
jgi:hypothetical protein